MKNIKELDVILKALAEPFPENLLQHKPQRDKKNNTTTYLTSIAWHTAVDRLDQVYPYWSQNVERVEVIGSMVVATVSISLQFTDGMVTRTNTGIEEISADSWGDPVSNAVAMGFKRAAALFGVGRYLYYKDAAPVANSYAASAATGHTLAPNPQQPHTLAPSDGVKMASEGQGKAIYAISKANNLDIKEVCGGKSTRDLTSAAASEIIDRLNRTYPR